MSKFEGFYSPTYTQIPNNFFSELLPEIQDKSELKILLVAMRYTFGFHRLSAGISRSFFMQATGLGDEGVAAGIQKCLDRGTLLLETPHTFTTEAIYRINMVDPEQDGRAVLLSTYKIGENGKSQDGRAVLRKKVLNIKKVPSASRNGNAPKKKSKPRLLPDSTKFNLSLDEISNEQNIKHAETIEKVIRVLERMTLLRSSDDKASRATFVWAAEKLLEKKATPSQMKVFSKWFIQPWRTNHPTLKQIVNLWDKAMVETGEVVSEEPKVHEVYPISRKVHVI